MGVHNIAEYVKYHQAKLREQQAQSNPVPTQPPKKRGGVNQIRSAAEFKAHVVDRTALSAEDKDKIVLVDFYADWCGPCKAIAPVIAKMSNEYGEKLLVYKVDVDNVPAIAQEYGIRAMPTFKIFDKSGNEIDELVGADARQIKAKLEQAGAV